MEIELVILGCLFLGALTRTTFGFGDAAVAMPLLALAGVSPMLAIPLVGLVGAAVAAAVAIADRAAIELRYVKHLSIATAAGIPAGVIIALHAPERLIMVGLGAVLIGYGTYSILRPSRRPVRHGAWASVFGLLSGCLGGAYNLNGVPVAVYGSMAKWEPRRFRSTLQTHFLISSAMVLAGHGLGGLWSGTVWRLFGLSVPLLVVAIVLGRWAGRRMRAEPFAMAVSALIVALGVLLLV